MASSFVYTIATDIVSGKLDVSRLAKEIQDAPAITIALDDIVVDGPTFTVSFKADLPAPDKTALDGNTLGPAGGIIGAHSGEPLESNVAPVMVCPPGDETLSFVCRGRQFTIEPAATTADDLAPGVQVSAQGAVFFAEGRVAGDKLKLEIVEPPSTVVATLAVDLFVPSDGPFSVMSDATRSMTATQVLRCTYEAAVGGGTRTLTAHYRLWEA
jgi:hypothetical protein